MALGAGSRLTADGRHRDYLGTGYRAGAWTERSRSAWLTHRQSHDRHASDLR
jgi:hypothetical protein